MPFLAYIARVIAGTLLDAGARDVFSQVGKYAVRQASLALIRHIRNGTATRKGAQTIK